MVIVLHQVPHIVQSASSSKSKGHSVRIGPPLKRPTDISNAKVMKQSAHDSRYFFFVELLLISWCMFTDQNINPADQKHLNTG